MDDPCRSYEAGLTLAADGKSWSYTPPASDGSAEYEITYTTRVKVEENTVEVTNTVSDAHNRTVEGDCLSILSLIYFRQGYFVPHCIAAAPSRRI